VSSFRWICRRLHWQVEKRLQGRSGQPYRCISLSFRGVTGPEVFNRICEDIVGGGNSAQHRFENCFRELGRVGTQATELLIAVHFGPLDSLRSLLFRTALKKKQRLRSYLESAQPASCRLCSSAWSSGIGAPIFHCRLCGPDSRVLPVTPWCLEADVRPLGRAWDCWKPRRFRP